MKHKSKFKDDLLDYHSEVHKIESSSIDDIDIDFLNEIVDEEKCPLDGPRKSINNNVDENSYNNSKISNSTSSSSSSLNSSSENSSDEDVNDNGDRLDRNEHHRT